MEQQNIEKNSLLFPLMKKETTEEKKKNLI